MVTRRSYVPKRGDIVWLTFHPQAGHEQAGRRPAVVLSPESYNGKTGLAVFCPVTSHKKGYPFEVDLPIGLSVKGVILSDQVKNLDWRARQAEYADSLPQKTITEILETLGTLLSQ